MNNLFAFRVKNFQNDARQSHLLDLIVVHREFFFHSVRDSQTAIFTFKNAIHMPMYVHLARL